MIFWFCHNTSHVVVTSNCTVTFALSITQTFLQTAKHFFSKIGITRCNRIQVPMQYRRERLSQRSCIILDMRSLRLPPCYFFLIGTPSNDQQKEGNMSSRVRRTENNRVLQAMFSEREMISCSELSSGIYTAVYCNEFAGFYFTMEVYYTQSSIYNSLITIDDASRILTHV
jgi:hypothetical protein